MTVNTPEQTSLDLLISLKSQYEFALTEANSKAVYLREQLAHVNALLLNQLLPSKQLQPLPAIDSAAPTLALSNQIEALGEQLVLTAPVIATEPLRATDPSASEPLTPKLSSAKGALKTARVKSKRTSLSLLPAYQGLSKLDAIAQVLEAERDQEVTIDSVVQTLYGNLSAAEHKAERLRMKTALFQGVKKNLWNKSSNPSRYFIGSLKGQGSKTEKENLAPKANEAIAPSEATKAIKSSKASPRNPKAESDPTNKVSKRNSLPLLPEYAGTKKLDAIAIVLGKHPDEVLHHDTIIQMLYGDLSLVDLKAERVRIKTALLTGVKNKRWDKSPIPSSYVLKSGAASKPKSSIKTVKPRSSTKAHSSRK